MRFFHAPLAVVLTFHLLPGVQGSPPYIVRRRNGFDSSSENLPVRLRHHPRRRIPFVISQHVGLPEGRRGHVFEFVKKFNELSIAHVKVGKVSGEKTWRPNSEFTGGCEGKGGVRKRQHENM